MDHLRNLEKAIDSAIDWLENRASAELIGPDNLNDVKKRIRRISWNTTKLKQSENKNSSVAVYGPSQAGKSFLVSVLAKPTDTPLIANFPGKDNQLNYIRDINPAGDTESTGIVTRFSSRGYVADSSHPIRLKLLLETDLVCILMNSFFLDIDHGTAEDLSPEDLKDHISQVQTSSIEGSVDHLGIKDFWEIEDYIREKFINFSYAKTLINFCENIGEAALKLGLEERAKLYSLFWGKLEFYDNLFLELAKDLESLKFAENVDAPVSALHPKADSIIDVKELSNLLSNITTSIGVKVNENHFVSIKRQNLTALTAELWVPMKKVPHSFLNFTDLLDFPGARNRFTRDASEIDLENRENLTAVADMFLRGKVAFLFDRYVSGEKWFCNAGYTKSQNKCVSIFQDMGGQPKNSYVSGEKWFCNAGYTKSQNKCVSIFQISATSEKQTKTDNLNFLNNSEILRNCGMIDNTFFENLTTLQVRSLQIKLNGKGYGAGPVDGLSGLKTVSAIKKWQGSVGEPRTGFLTRAQWFALFDENDTACSSDQSGSILTQNENSSSSDSETETSTEIEIVTEGRELSSQPEGIKQQGIFASISVAHSDQGPFDPYECAFQAVFGSQYDPLKGAIIVFYYDPKTNAYIGDLETFNLAKNNPVLKGNRLDLSFNALEGSFCKPTEAIQDTSFKIINGTHIELLNIQLEAQKGNVGSNLKTNKITSDLEPNGEGLFNLLDSQQREPEDEPDLERDTSSRVEQLENELASALSELISEQNNVKLLEKALEALKLQSEKKQLSVEQKLSLVLAELVKAESVSETQQAQLKAAILAKLSAEELSEKRLDDAAQKEVAVLNAQIVELRRQLDQLQAILDASEESDRKSNVRIKNLGNRLNAALAKAAAEERRRRKLEEKERERLQEELEKAERNENTIKFSKIRENFLKKEIQRLNSELSSAKAQAASEHALRLKLEQQLNE